ncbi:hypothetical protein [Tepidanaerobacter acetatoxydans]|uniref:hypothetical protein n=1 Tax=Tepidanaerobacter acetatoxydans TaxID=499229 RepID=UPI001BD5CED1|nr:hypothetical protein [Tepidanaerobacter acetatoxydans]
MPSFVTGLQNLIKAATGWVTGLAAVTMVLMVSYHALMRSTAQDEMAATQHSRAIGNVLKYGVIVIIANVLVSTIVSYF